MRRLIPRLAGRPGAFTRLLLGLVLMLTCLPTARAQVDDSNAARYWTLEKQRMERMRTQEMRRIQQRPTHLIRRSAPVKGFTRPAPTADAPGTDGAAPDALPSTGLPPTGSPATSPEGIVATPAPNPPDASPAPAPPIPAAAKSVIAVLGDNLGQLLGVGLTEAYADRPAVTILRRAKENSGLVRDDYYDWMKAARELLDGPEHIDVAVILIGSNDRQQLRADGAGYDARSPKWEDLYKARVAALANLFKAKNVPLLWVGLPIMGSERLSNDMLDFNEVYKSVSAETGVVYIDIWEAFADDRGQFSSYGPDVNGQMVRLRAGDGVHFTRAGARKLAHFVEGEIRRVLEDTKPAASDPAALEAVAPAALGAPAAAPGLVEPAPGAGKPPSAPSVAAIVAPPVPAPVLKPAAGPIVPLTAPPLSPGGKLATMSAGARSAAGDREAAAVVQQGLVQGRALESRPGRADDFAWPRN